jgi:hypothetical protein
MNDGGLPTPIKYNNMLVRGFVEDMHKTDSAIWLVKNNITKNSGNVYIVATLLV